MMYVTTSTLSPNGTFLFVSFYALFFLPILTLDPVNVNVCVSVFPFQGGCIHDGTWQSAIYGFSDSQKLQSLRRKFNHKPLPAVGSKLKRRYVAMQIPLQMFYTGKTILGRYPFDLVTDCLANTDTNI